MDAHTRTRRRTGLAASVIAVSMLAACTGLTPGPTEAPTAEPTAGVVDRSAPIEGGDAEEVAAIRAAVEEAMAAVPARAVIVRVLRGDDVVLSQAWGESMAGVPATVDMHFRSGAVAIPQVATVLFQLVDEGVVSLDDPIAQWLPDVPSAEQVTLGQLARMTSGYADYVQNQQFLDAVSRDPYRQWTPEELYSFGTSQPLTFAPGTNWGYAHTNYVLLSLALERITGQSMPDVIRERVLDPLGMTETADPGTPEILSPVLHAFDAERKEFLGIPADVPFIEDSTYWNPSWSLGPGAVQNTDIADMATVMRAVGRGDLVSPASYEQMIAPTLRGKTTRLDTCPSTCFAQNELYTYGYGIVLSGDWLLQNPQYHGYAGVSAYLPSEDVTIAVAATYADAGFDPVTGAAIISNIANPLWSAVAGVVAPDAVTPGG